MLAREPTLQCDPLAITGNTRNSTNTAAPLEAKWAALVDEVDPRGCKDWMPGGRLVTEATQDIKTGLWNSSFSHFKYLAKDGRTMLYPIEPLFSSLRHPYLLTSTDNSTRATALKTSYA